VTDPDDDDLHGRQLLLLLLFFGTVGGGLYFLGWLTRPSFFYNNPLVCAAIAGGACYPARFLVEQFAWWNRLEQPSKRTQRRRERARERDLAEAREAAQARLAEGESESPADGGRHRRAGRGRPDWLGRFSWLGRLGGGVRPIVGGVLVLGCFAIAPLGIADARHEQQVARSAPVRSAVVLSVHVDKWSKNHDVTITVTHPGDGSTVEIDGADQLEPLPGVGDRLDVQIDPDDPSNVLAADADWTVHWYVYALFVLGALAGAAVVALFFF
jgi:hypothetical protein